MTELDGGDRLGGHVDHRNCGCSHVLRVCGQGGALHRHRDGGDRAGRGSALPELNEEARDRWPACCQQHREPCHGLPAPLCRQRAVVVDHFPFVCDFIVHRARAAVHELLLKRFLQSCASGRHGHCPEPPAAVPSTPTGGVVRHGKLASHAINKTLSLYSPPPHGILAAALEDCAARIGGRPRGPRGKLPVKLPVLLPIFPGHRSCNGAN